MFWCELNFKKIYTKLQIKLNKFKKEYVYKINHFTWVGVKFARADKIAIRYFCTQTLGWKYIKRKKRADKFKKGDSMSDNFFLCIV